MEITKREIIASITIIAVWMCLGFLIAERIDTWQQDKNIEYDKAARIETQELFEHGMETNLRNAFVYGQMEAKEPVTYSEIDGSYSYITKIKEEYTMHTRTVTKTRTNSKGKTETYEEIETYWTWDEVGRESQISKSMVFLGNEFDSRLIDLPAAEYVDTIKASTHVRYQYYGVPKIMIGTLCTSLENGNISENSKFYADKSIDETVKMLETKGATIIFWILWIIAMIGLVWGFYYLDNRWLNV